MKRFAGAGSPRVQSAYKHLLGVFGLTAVAAGCAYWTFKAYPVSFGEGYVVDIGLGTEQGESVSDAVEVRKQYASFSKQWKVKGKDAQKKVWQDLKTFKQQQANMSVVDMQQFDKEANSALEKLDKI